MAFQMIDDLLDLTGDQKSLGKSLGSDICQGRLTLPVIQAVSQADKKHKKWIIETLKTGQIDQDILSRMIELVRHYGGIEYTLKKAQPYARACRESLEGLEETEYSNALIFLADYVVNRVN